MSGKGQNSGGGPLRFLRGAREALPTWLPAALVFAVGALLIVLGVLNGDIVQLLRKATKICLECIGIG
ncbi:MAG: CD1871A family CXXC motif-containing protein [Fastidiosipilaceae bacterium]